MNYQYENGASNRRRFIFHPAGPSARFFKTIHFTAFLEFLEFLKFLEFLEFRKIPVAISVIMLYNELRVLRKL